MQSSGSEKRIRISGLSFALGGIIAILLTTASEAAFVGYSVRTDAISGLGGAGSPTEIFWNFQLLISGLLWCVGTLMLFRAQGHWVRTLFLLLTGIGLLLVSISPWNVDPAVHGIGAQMAAYFGIISCFLSYGITTSPFRLFSLFAGTFALAALLLSFFGFSALGPGGIERMIYYPVFLWEIGFGGYLMGGNQVLPRQGH